MKTITNCYLAPLFLIADFDHLWTKDDELIYIGELSGEFELWEIDGEPQYNIINSLS